MQTLNFYSETRPVSETFKSLISYYREHHPEIETTLRQPASDDKISETENVLNCEFPADFKAVYKIADGQTEQNIPLFQNGYEFMSLKYVCEQWTLLKNLYDSVSSNQTIYNDKNEILDTWWHPMWIPFGYTQWGNLMCLDLNPGKKGVKGQIIEFIHDDSPRYYFGSNINDFIGELDTGLKSGKYFMHPENEVITNES